MSARLASVRVVIAFSSLGLLRLLAGCGGSTTRPELPDPSFGALRAEGRQVLWTSDQPARGAVRYGLISGAQDRLAYPAAAGGADKAYLLEHAVPLGDIPANTPVFLRRTLQVGDGRLFVAPEETLTFSVEALSGQAPRLRFTALDVQFGDAHVLQLPTSDKVVAIDAGDPGVARTGETAPAHVKRWLDDRGITRLDVAMATHIHADHIGGFVRAGDGTAGLLETYEVGLYLDVPAVSRQRSLYTQALNQLQAAGVPRLVITPGMSDVTDPDALAWDPLVHVLVLNAGSQAEWAGAAYDGDALNNDSIVLKISYGDVDLITGGDCEVVGESRIIAHYGAALAGVELFKVSHHGRYDANSLAYLQAMTPRTAVVPVAFVAYDEGPAGGASASAQALGFLAGLRVDVFRFDAADPLDRPQDNQTFWHTTFVTDGYNYEMRIAPSVWGQ